MIKARVLGGLRRLQPWVPIPRGHGVVLCYHLIGADTGSEVDLPLRSFRAHLDWLMEQVDVVPIRDVLTRGPNLRVALTFDDAFQNFSTTAWPELRDRGLPAMLYVPTGFVSGESACPLTGCDLPACTWEELGRMQEEGLDLGSHTHTHPNLRRLSLAAVHDELGQAKGRMNDELGLDIEDFCYPQAKHSPSVVSAVAQHHRRAVIGRGLHVRAKTSPMKIPRIPVRQSQHDLIQLMRRGLWLEEFVADTMRQHR